MKINPLVLLISFIIISYALTIKVKNNSQNKIKFSTSNYVSENPQKPSVMESVIFAKSIGVDSRLVLYMNII